MKVAVLFSGGKDSVFATFWALMHGFDPILVTIRPPQYSMMFHHPNIEWTKKQAQVLNLAQFFVETTEENWREKLLEVFKKLKIDGIATGAVGSEYQKRRIDSIGEELGVPTYAPLWHKDISINLNNPKVDPLQSDLLSEMLKYFEIFVTAVSAEGLGKEFLGETFNKLISANKKGIHPFLEGGEGETFVTDAPFFKNKINIKKWKKEFDGVRGVAEIIEANLINKTE